MISRIFLYESYFKVFSLLFLFLIIFLLINMSFYNTTKRLGKNRIGVPKDFHGSSDVCGQI